MCVYVYMCARVCVCGWVGVLPIIQKALDLRRRCFCTETDEAMAPAKTFGFFVRDHIARLAP